MSVSTLPLLHEFFHTILTLLAHHPEGIRRRDIYEPVADAMRLSKEEREELIPSGEGHRYRYRIGWSLHELKAAGYAETPVSGLWRITARGRDLLAAHPERLEEATARGIAREARLASGTEPGGEVPESLGAGVEQTPEERIDAAMKEIEGAVARELLERIAQSPPAFFEGLVLDLLHALGYGSSRDDLKRLGGSGDGGVDGVIALDRLGFEKVYVQAKRWQGSVGRPEIQSFFGALAGQKAKKGVFITTSTFTKEAREYGAHVSENVVLLDGARLTALMIESGVAVTHYRTIRLPRVDGDYFEAE
jgi:restriction system protein